MQFLLMRERGFMVLVKVGGGGTAAQFVSAAFRELSVLTR